MCSTYTSGPRRALFWIAFCQSILYYVTSVFAFSNKFLKKLQRIQQRVLLGTRTWIPMQHIASVFAMFKIGPCSQIHIACQKANLAAVLRMYGHQELLTSSSQTSMMQRARKSLETFSTADVLKCNAALAALTTCTAAPYTRRAKQVVAKFLGDFQFTLKERSKLAAVAHIDKLAQKSPFMLFALSPVSTLIQHLSKTPQKFLSSTDRFYFLRWLICSEVDADYREKLENLCASGCCPFGAPNVSRIKPWGRAGASLCNKCFFTAYGTASAWRTHVHPLAHPCAPSSAYPRYH